MGERSYSEIAGLRRVGAGARVAALLLLLSMTGAVGATPGAGQILRQQDEAATDILTADRVVRLTLRLPVSAEAAFDAWTDANQLVGWLADWAEMTVAEGEGFRIGWDGYEAAWEGVYVEVDRPARLAFTWSPPVDVFPEGAYATMVTLSFEEIDEGATVMTLEHSGFAAPAEMEAQLQAWRGYLFALRAFLLQPPTGN